MYISLVLFKENIGIFNLEQDVFHQHCKSYKKDIHYVFQHYFADGLAALYSSVDLSSVFLFSVFFRCSWSSAGLWARTSNRSSMRASTGTVLVSWSYFNPREGMLDSCWTQISQQTNVSLYTFCTWRCLSQVLYKHHITMLLY